ncbi:hypothetical protein CDD82_7081 [Ophiocordyceps australis]|uniref:Utp8 beta-propeller domain-containing protein n=1 Tax=Ophiocordyceps australis TaxID=1399860 RepID=A0A2C5YT41_9HYPO|nr:hypothetical protein CDD82_7081 [Ophiocordyceps australis]
MASEYRIHRPYVLASLPPPLDSSGGRTVAREVYGQRNGLKRRKRTELVVGIDGEAASIYDLAASRLITSYPIPPQESFTCPPLSVRVRHASNSDVLRYTFIATSDATSQRLTLFKDVVHSDGNTTSTTCSHTLATSLVKHITFVSSTCTSPTIGDIVVICEAGEVACLSGQDLVMLWSASALSAIQDAVASAVQHVELEFITSTSLEDSKQAMYKNRLDIFSALPKTLDSDAALHVLVAKSGNGIQVHRHLVILATVSASSTNSADVEKVIAIDVTPMPDDTSMGNETASYQVDIQSGKLLQLAAGAVNVYDLTGSIPKKQSTVRLQGAESFLRLYKPFILSASSNSIGLYNYHFRSIHAEAELDLSEVPNSKGLPLSCHLITYLRSMHLAIALVGNTLVSIHVEPPKAHGKRRREGLLIDSIARGAPTDVCLKKMRHGSGSDVFSSLIPGTMTEKYLAKYDMELQETETLFSTNSLAMWEDKLRQKFSVKVCDKMDTAHSSKPNSSLAQPCQELPEWEWLKDGVYPAVDRRWVHYAMSRVFSVDIVASQHDVQQPKLRLVLPDSNVLTYLVVAGHLSISNLQSAFRSEVSTEGSESRAVASDLIDCLTDADPSALLLLNYLQATKMGEMEIVLSIRALMRSLGLTRTRQDSNKVKALKDEAHHGGEEYERDLEDLEQRLADTERYFQKDSATCLRGLTLALTKLWKLPVGPTVAALRTVLDHGEIGEVILLLRRELINGSWTSRYLDSTIAEAEDNEPPPDGSIALIADLLGRCVDAVGVGGWIFNDATTWASKDGPVSFLRALRMEARAALIGIEEVLYLRSILCEAVRFGEETEASLASRQSKNGDKHVQVRVESQECRMMPYGLKVKQLPCKDKVVSGGAVVERSMREMGHLISQAVGAYSLEQITL